MPAVRIVAMHSPRYRAVASNSVTTTSPRSPVGPVPYFARGWQIVAPDPGAAEVSGARVIGGEPARELAGLAQTTLPAKLELVLGAAADEVLRSAADADQPTLLSLAASSSIVVLSDCCSGDAYGGTSANSLSFRTSECRSVRLARSSRAGGFRIGRCGKPPRAAARKTCPRFDTDSSRRPRRDDA